MKWKEAAIAKILFIIAGMLAEDENLKKELNALSAHISVGDWNNRGQH